MPFHNVAAFFAESIESVRAQRYQHWELLLCDDGGTDGSRDIAERYASVDPARIRILEHEDRANRGASSYVMPSASSWRCTRSKCALASSLRCAVICGAPSYPRGTLTVGSGSASTMPVGSASSTPASLKVDATSARKIGYS